EGGWVEVAVVLLAVPVVRRCASGSPVMPLRQSPVGPLLLPLVLAAEPVTPVVRRFASAFVVGSSATSPIVPLSFTLDSGASNCFFLDCTVLTPLHSLVTVALADPVTTTLPCLAAPSGFLTGYYTPLFSKNLVGVSYLHDLGIVTTSPLDEHVAACTVGATRAPLATFHRELGSGLYSLHTGSHLLGSGLVRSGQVAAVSCDCRSLTNPSVLWHHRLGHPSFMRLSRMIRHRLVSGLPESLALLPRSPAPPCTPCVEGRQRAVPHSSLFPRHHGSLTDPALGRLGPLPSPWLTSGALLPDCGGQLLSLHHGFTLATEGRRAYHPRTVVCPVRVMSGGAGGAAVDGGGTGAAGPGGLGSKGAGGVKVETFPMEDTAVSTRRPRPASPPGFPYVPQFPPCSSLRPATSKPTGVYAGEPRRSRYRADGPFHLVLHSCVPPPPVLPQPPESSLTLFHDQLSDNHRAFRPVVSCVLSALVTHLSAPPLSISALVTTDAGFASSHNLDYVAHLVSGPARSPSSWGAPVFPLEVLEDWQFELGFLAAVVPQLCAMLLAPEGDPDALEILIPCTHTEGVSGPKDSYWIAAKEAEMASYRSTGTYIDAVPPPGTNVVSGMLALQALDFFPSSADPSLFVPHGSTPFFVLVYVDDLVFTTPDRRALASMKEELQRRHTCIDFGELQHYLGLQITMDRAAHTITLTQSQMVEQILMRFHFPFTKA
ncbi:unnamed protein product, partial [Closterium sp. NIES-54]